MRDTEGGNLPGGDDKVLAGFEESSVTKSGFLWSVVTYDDAGAPTKSVMRDTEGTLIFAERAPAEAATSSGKGGRPRRRARGTSMTCRTGTDEVPMPGKDYELMLEDVPNHGLGSARANFEAGAPVAAVCAADGTPRAKVLYELDSDLVTRSYGGSVAAAVADVTDLTNLGSEQYLLQAGVELVTDIFVDTSQSPIGASYSGSGAFDVLRTSRRDGGSARPSERKQRSTASCTSSAARTCPQTRGSSGLRCKRGLRGQRCSR